MISTLAVLFLMGGEVSMQDDEMIQAYAAMIRPYIVAGIIFAVIIGTIIVTIFLAGMLIGGLVM